MVRRSQNGITDFFAKIGHFDEVCAKNSDGTETCVDGDQLKSLLGSAAASTSNLGVEAPSGSSAEVEATTDTATSTTLASEEEEAAGAPTSEGAEAPADLPALQGDADTGSTVPADDSSPAEPAPTPEAANDNEPADPLPATGTE